MTSWGAQLLLAAVWLDAAKQAAWSLPTLQPTLNAPGDLPQAPHHLLLRLIEVDSNNCASLVPATH